MRGRIEILRERGTVEDAAAIVGVSTRTIQLMAQNGELPGAVKVRRRWTFNLQRLREHMRAEEFKSCNQRLPKGPTGGTEFSGAALRSTAGNADGLYERAIQKLRRSVASRVRNG
jgi:excisionase family DNA binding protein